MGRKDRRPEIRFDKRANMRAILTATAALSLIFGSAFGQTTRTNPSAASTSPTIPSSSSTSANSPCASTNPTSPCYSANAPRNPCYSAAAPAGLSYQIALEVLHRLNCDHPPLVSERPRSSSSRSSAARQWGILTARTFSSRPVSSRELCGLTAFVGNSRVWIAITLLTAS